MTRSPLADQPVESNGSNRTWNLWVPVVPGLPGPAGANTVRGIRMESLMELVNRCRRATSREEWVGATEALARAVAPPLRAFVLGKGVQDAADDVFQEVLTAIVTRLDWFEGRTEGEFRGWCYRIARNKCSDHLRRKYADRSVPLDDEGAQREIEASVSVEGLSPGDRMDLEDALELLRQARPPCYDYLIQYYIQGWDYQEIAAEAALTYDNARMHVQRCLALAQKLVNQSR